MARLIVVQLIKSPGGKIHTGRKILIRMSGLVLTVIPPEGKSPVDHLLLGLSHFLDPVGKTDRITSIEFIPFPIAGLHINQPGPIEINISPCCGIHMFTDGLVPSDTAESESPLL